MKKETIYRKVSADMSDAECRSYIIGNSCLKEEKDLYVLSEGELKELVENAFDAGSEYFEDKVSGAYVLFPSSKPTVSEYIKSLNI